MTKKVLTQKELIFSIYELAKDRFVLEESHHNSMNLEVAKNSILEKIYFNSGYSSLYVSIGFATEPGHVEFTAYSSGIQVAVPGSNINDFDITSLLKRTVNVLKKLPIIKAKIVKEPETKERMFVVGDKKYKVLEEIKR